MKNETEFIKTYYEMRTNEENIDNTFSFFLDKNSIKNLKDTEIDNYPNTFEIRLILSNKLDGFFGFIFGHKCFLPYKS